MPQITVDIRGIEGISRALVRFGARLEKETTKELYTALDDTRKALGYPDVSAYPPERRGQRYIRTGKLGRGWRITRTQTGWRLSNRARSKYGRKAYGAYVVGDAEGKRQAKVHVRRWRVMRRELDKRKRSAIQRINRQLAHYARREGL